MPFDKYTTASTFSLFTDMLQQIADRGRTLISRGRDARDAPTSLTTMADELLSGSGEASGIARAAELLEAYRTAGSDIRHEFLRALASDYGPDQSLLDSAIQNYQKNPTAKTALELHHLAEPRRQELFRKLNRAPGGTLSLVRMREDVLAHKRPDVSLHSIDSDFVHLFGSWFNRGFLMLRQLDWSSSAKVLDKIIEYEAVHPIADFEALRHRLAPPDRRLFAFFHPALVDEPLIFVEVALTNVVPMTISSILAPDRKPIPPETATTAVFYSISNCQRGLTGISFGNFLIKQVVEDLRRDLPNLKTFVTLSPVPGFVSWLREESMKEDSTFLRTNERAALSYAFASSWPANREALADKPLQLDRIIANYLFSAKTSANKPLDPVARFHLGNGARLERVNTEADLSSRGIKDAAGFMVNYLYDIQKIERNHEAFAERGEVVVSTEIMRLMRAERRMRSDLT